MVLVASEQKLLMMRPHQIYAVKNIVECIAKNLGNGYIWHTTGSGGTAPGNSDRGSLDRRDSGSAWTRSIAWSPPPHRETRARCSKRRAAISRAPQRRCKLPS